MLKFDWPTVLYRQPMRTRRQSKKLGFLTVLLLLAITYIGWTLLRPLPAIQPSEQKSLALPDSSANLTWPTKAQAAASLLSSETVITHGAQKSAPMASTAKVITALMVLQKKPLTPGEAGPMYTITAADIDIYKKYVAQDGSVLPVSLGMKLTEYQMIEAIMLPSANNIADALAIWTYGSLEEYSRAANAYLKSQGINNTQVGSDASGLSPDSKTTAQDLVAIGKLAMKHPVFAEVVNKSSTSDIPGNPLVHNVNNLLGKDNIVGIKTGNSDQAGGVFLGAAKHTVKGQKVTIITAVVGEPTRAAALSASRALIRSAAANFASTNIASKQTILATYKSPWGETRQATLAQDAAVDYWKGEEVKADLSLGNAKVNQPIVGSFSAAATSASPKTSLDVTLNKPFTAPPIKWRLLHPF